MRAKPFACCELLRDGAGQKRCSVHAYLPPPGFPHPARPLGRARLGRRDGMTMHVRLLTVPSSNLQYGFSALKPGFDPF